MLTTPLRQLTGGRYPVGRLCMDVLVYIGFLGLRNMSTLRLLKLRCSRGRYKGVVGFETDLVFYVAWLVSAVFSCF